MATKIFKAYKDYVLTHNRRPTSVYLFCKEYSFSENDFYKKYHSFEFLENQAIEGLFKSVVLTLNKDENFEKYTSREKMLALFYAWTEKALTERSFLDYLSKNNSIQDQMGLSAARMQFNDFSKDVLDGAVTSGEVIERKFISDKYYHALWSQYLLIHKYWLNDKSKDFEKTDAFIEKSTHLAFDLFGQSALDSALDLAKFIFQK